LGAAAVGYLFFVARAEQFLDLADCCKVICLIMCILLSCIMILLVLAAWLASMYVHALLFPCSVMIRGEKSDCWKDLQSVI
jgi:hypothetical protein